MIQNSWKIYLFFQYCIFRETDVFLSARQSFNPLRMENFTFGNHNMRKKKKEKTFNLIL